MLNYQRVINPYHLPPINYPIWWRGTQELFLWAMTNLGFIYIYIYIYNVGPPR